MKQGGTACKTMWARLPWFDKLGYLQVVVIRERGEMALYVAGETVVCISVHFGCDKNIK